MTAEVQVEKVKLATARAQLRLSQRELARLARISIAVISNSENGYAIRLLSAYAILEAINTERVKRGWTPLALEQMDIKIQGEGD